MTATRDPWLTTLEEGARLLQAGKPQEAAQALAGLQALCAASAPQPAPEVVVQARELLQRCFSSEAGLRQRVLEDMNRLASSQRARVYRHPAQGTR
ncbi:MAG: hypothetical protein WCG85_14225 [Polyangia bacterium]